MTGGFRWAYPPLKTEDTLLKSKGGVSQYIEASRDFSCAVTGRVQEDVQAFLKVYTGRFGGTKPLWKNRRGSSRGGASPPFHVMNVQGGLERQSPSNILFPPLLVRRGGKRGEVFIDLIKEMLRVWGGGFLRTSITPPPEILRRCAPPE